MSGGGGGGKASKKRHRAPAETPAQDVWAREQGL